MFRRHNGCHQAPALNQKYIKVISSKKPTLRRRKGTGTTINTVANKRPVKRTKAPDSVVIDIDDSPPLSSIPDFVGVKQEDLWLCQPSVAHVITYFSLIVNMLLNCFQFYIRICIYMPKAWRVDTVSPQNICLSVALESPSRCEQHWSIG